MSGSTLATTVPLEGAPSLLPLARSLLDALGLGACELPTPEAFASPMRVTRELSGARVSLARRTLPVDPYAGGASDEQELRVEAPGEQRLRVSVAEVAWVGPELVASARGPAEWVAAITAVVDAFIARHARLTE